MTSQEEFIQNRLEKARAAINRIKTAPDSQAPGTKFDMAITKTELLVARLHIQHRKKRQEPRTPDTDFEGVQPDPLDTTVQPDACYNFSNE
jgi:hypothetical protein